MICLFSQDYAARRSINPIIWPFTCVSIRRKNHTSAICVAYRLLLQAIWVDTWRATIISNRTNATYAIEHLFCLAICRTIYDPSIHMNVHSIAMCAAIHFRGANYFGSTNNCTVKNDSNVNIVIKYSHNRPDEEGMRFVFIMRPISQHQIWNNDISTIIRATKIDVYIREREKKKQKFIIETTIRLN